MTDFSRSLLTENNRSPLLHYEPKYVLALFNEYDAQANNVVDALTARSILERLNARQAELPEGRYLTFDDILSALSTAETPQHPSSYILAFLKMLVEYQRKCEANEQFEQAQKTEVRIGDIRDREIKRRQQQLKHRHRNQLDRIDHIQQGQLKQFSEAWNAHIDDFERDSGQLMAEMKKRHVEEGERQQALMRSNAERHSPKVAKQLIELRVKQKSLLKKRDYPEVIRTRKAVDKLHNLQAKQLTQAQQLAIEKRLKQLRKHQTIALTALKDKIHAQRLNLIAKRKEDTECLVIRIRNLRGDIRRKMADQQKKLNDQLRQEFNNSCLYSVRR